MPHWQRSVHNKFFVLQEHLAEEQSLCGSHYVGDPSEDPAELCWPVPTLWLGYGLSGHVVAGLQG